MDKIEQFKKDSQKWLPGVLLTLVLAIVAKGFEYILLVDYIGASVLALFLVMIYNYFIPIDNSQLESGVMFASKRILKFSIILLGASLNITTILEAGKFSLIVMVFTLIAAFGGGYLLGKLLGLDWRLSRDRKSVV